LYQKDTKGRWIQKNNPACPVFLDGALVDSFLVR